MSRGGNMVANSADYAEALAQQGKWAAAEEVYRKVLEQTHVINYEYDEWLRRLVDVYRSLGLRQEAALVYMYLHHFEQAKANLTGADAAVLLGFIAENERKWSVAAACFTEAGLPVHAAVATERAQQDGAAAGAWRRLIAEHGATMRAYELALAHFNMGMALARVEGVASDEARRALIESQRRLEFVADEFEERGEYERAFDCYAIVLRLGKQMAQFENLAEGYVNCIRVLTSDNLKFFALQYYEDFVRLALERDEYHAAATMLQEAATYAARCGLPYDRHYIAKAARAWLRCAEHFAGQGVSVQLIENALLASASAFTSVNDFASVGKVFEKLAQLELGERAKKRFTTIAARYHGAAPANTEFPGLPDYLKQQHAYADIWFADLLEWEARGRAELVAASIVGDLRYPNGIRRRALLILLTTAAARREQRRDEPAVLEALAGYLGELQSYVALAPLEQLFQHPHSGVKQAAIRALRHLYFKRSFALLLPAIDHADVHVRAAAQAAIVSLHFPHAFNPLARIYQQAAELKFGSGEAGLNRDVARACLQAMGKLQSLEAAEFLIQVIRHSDGERRKAAVAALSNMDNADIVPLLRQFLEIDSDPGLRELLAGLVRRYS